MKHVIGIDLGTTYSAVATLGGAGKPELVPNLDGERLTPSVLYKGAGDSTVHVGSLARRRMSADRQGGLRLIKRSMGENVQLELGDRQITPELASSMILRKLADAVKAEVGEISRAVVTIPANFGEAARQATLRAAELAGLPNVELINEPTAAVLYYSIKSPIQGRTLVFDFGGGTFDATLAEVNGNNVNVVASAGDNHLGGADFDEIILDKFSHEWQSHYGEDLFDVDFAKEQLEETAELTKKQLSKLESCEATIAKQSRSLIVRVTRAEIETAGQMLVEKLMLGVDGVLSDAGWSPADVEHILLVGGATRMPVVRHSLERALGRQPESRVNVDEAVAMGAAIYAGLQAKSGELNPVQAATLRDVRMTDVTTAHFATTCIDADTGRESISIIIPKNTPLPASKTDTYYTISPGQTVVECKIVQTQVDWTTDAEDLMPGDILAVKELGDLPADRPPGQPIEVTYSYDLNGMMHCSFRDVQSGKMIEVPIAIRRKADQESASSANDARGGREVPALDDFLID